VSNSEVTLVDRMGDDLTVVNAARVSFAKQAERVIFSDGGLRVERADINLIKFLAKHGHWTPFAHVQLTFRIKAPIFVARQLVKHQIGLTWNEVSRRYVQSEPEFYTPTVWRRAADNVKQGSSSEDSGWSPDWHGRVTATEMAMLEYQDALDSGVCPEQARMILPQSMMTEWYWTGSLVAFARVIQQRMHSTAQRETQDIAKMLLKELTAIDSLQYSVEALIHSKLDTGEE